MASKGPIFNVQFHYTNLAFKTPKWGTKMPKWAIKMLKLAICCTIFVAKSGVLNAKTYYLAFTSQQKTASFKAFMKVAQGLIFGLIVAFNHVHHNLNPIDKLSIRLNCAFRRNFLKEYIFFNSLGLDFIFCYHVLSSQTSDKSWLYFNVV